MSCSIYKLEDCCTIIAGQSPESKYYNVEGQGLPFFQGKADFGALYPKIRVFCSRPTQIAKKDDILLSVRAPVGPTNLAPCEACIGRGLTAIRPSKILLPKYVLLFFRYFETYLSLKGTGTTFKAITQDIIKNIEITVPSISEQRRIVSYIEELFSQLDKAIDTLKSIKWQLSVYRQSVLKEAFEGKWKFKERTGIPTTLYFKNVNENELLALKKLPSEWRYVYLSDLGDLSRGRSKHRPRNDTRLFENGKYPFFQTGDVKSAKKELFESEKLYGDFGLQQSRLWPAGTLCITIAANIAETCFLGVDGCFPDSIVGFTPNSKLVDKDYVRFFIEASKLRLWAFAPATAQKNINLATLENLVIPYCTLEEQHYIVQEIESRLSVCDSIEKTVDDILKQTDVMRKSILKDAFERRL